MTLDEVLDYKPHAVWQQSGQFELASFTHLEHAYVIQIERKNLRPLVGEKLKDAEVAFFRKDIGGDASFSSTGDTDYPFKVYGAVLNLLEDKLSEYDTFYFSAEARHSDSARQFEQKIDLYRFMADRLAKRSGRQLFERVDSRRHEFLVTTSSSVDASFIDHRHKALDEANLLP